MRRLPEQHRQVPAQRQDRTPAIGKRVHGKRWKCDAGVAEGRRCDEAGEAKPGRKVADQELQQSSERQIGDDKERRRGNDHRHIALEGNVQQPLENQRHRQHDQEEDCEQRRELAGERDTRVPTRAGEPGAYAAPPEFGADRVASGERDDHVNDGGQQSAQQELGIICLGVGQHDRLGNERSDARRLRSRMGSRARGGRGKARAQARRGNARCSQVLLVIEANNLRTALGLHVAFEIGRDIKCGDGVARPDRAGGRCEVPGAGCDAQIWRGGDLLDEGT